MNLVELAMAAHTRKGVDRLRRAMIRSAGDEWKRPLGDNWSNYSVLSTAADAESLLFERITNGQDAVIANAVWQTHGFDEADIPYATPRHAASTLLNWPKIAGDRPQRVELGRRVTVSFHDSDDSRTRPTVVVRDTGCGVGAADVPFTLCSLLGGNKQLSLWTLGTFGKGGSTCVPFSDATVVVTRRQPYLLRRDEDDLVSIALILREYRVKAPAWFYLVAAPFDDRRPSDSGDVFTVPAHEVTGFAPGTHIAHINYDLPNFGRQSLRSDSSIQIVGETALLDPVMPWRFEDNRSESNVRVSGEMEGGTGLTFVGSKPKLVSGRGQVLDYGSSEIPIVVGGDTHRLPVTWWMFEAGGRSSFIAKSTVVSFTSNGQTHHSWNEAAFASRTGLMKVGTRIFGHVETDALPIPVRSDLFTTDRTTFRASRDVQALERAVADWFANEEAVVAANRALIREAVRSHVGDDLTVGLLEQVNRQLALRGFGGGSEPGGDSTNGGGGRRKIDLLPEPTYLSGPEEVSALPGETIPLILEMNAVDRFCPDRGELVIDYDDDFPGAFSDGSSLQRGRLQTRLAVGEDAPNATWRVVFSFGFVSSAGNFKELIWETKVRVITERKTRGGGGSKPKGGGVALVWRTKADEDGWNEQTVGTLGSWPVDALREYSPVYAQRYAEADPDAMVETILLNEDFLFLKHYVKATVEGTRTEATVSRRRRQYALGVGVAVGLLSDGQRKVERQVARGEDVLAMDAKQFDDALNAAARGVLTLLPDFDAMLSEVGAGD